MNLNIFLMAIKVYPRNNINKMMNCRNVNSTFNSIKKINTIDNRVTKLMGCLRVEIIEYLNIKKFKYLCGFID